MDAQPMKSFDELSSKKGFVNADKLISQLKIRRCEELLAKLAKATDIIMISGKVSPQTNYSETDYILLNDEERLRIAEEYKDSPEAVTLCSVNRYLKQQKITKVVQQKMIERKNRSLAKRNMNPIANVERNMAADGYLPFFEMSLEQAIEFLKNDLDVTGNAIQTPTHTFYFSTTQAQLLSMTKETYLRAYEKVNNIPEKATINV